VFKKNQEKALSMATNKKFLKKLADQLIQHEGIRLKPYYCPAGKLTIGVEGFPMVSSGW